MTMNITGVELNEGEELIVRKQKINKTPVKNKVLERLVNIPVYDTTIYDEIVALELSYYNRNRYYEPRYVSANDMVIEEYQARIHSWQLTDPKRFADYWAHSREPTEVTWNAEQFTKGDRVQLKYFLDDSPGYKHLKGKTGTIIKAKNGESGYGYVIVQFDDMKVKQSLIPGILERIRKYDLPPVINPELIQTQRLGDGWSAYVTDYPLTWEYGSTKNHAIERLLVTWFHNIKNR